MLAAHTNMSESLEGDAEQPSCCTGNLRLSAHPMHTHAWHVSAGVMNDFLQKVTLLARACGL
jgi:hypothetical protein